MEIWTQTLEYMNISGMGLLYPTGTYPLLSGPVSSLVAPGARDSGPSLVAPGARDSGPSALEHSISQCKLIFTSTYYYVFLQTIHIIKQHHLTYIYVSLNANYPCQYQLAHIVMSFFKLFISLSNIIHY
jgi:hypothetical protein